MKKVTIYTDGACSGNPGPGGWAAILNYNGHEKVISGACPETTNNRMELFAVIEALRILKEPCLVEIYSDSAYFVNAIEEGWLISWQRNKRLGDLGAAKTDLFGDEHSEKRKQVKNIDLWTDYLLKSKKHQIKAIWVKGHSNNELNNRCDFLAREEIKKIL